MHSVNGVAESRSDTPTERPRIRRISRAHVKVAVSRVSGASDIPLPRYASMGAAGMDVCAAVAQPLTLNPQERALVPTGIRIALPQGYEAQVRPRSGLAIQHGIGMVNAPGTIDEDYRGEIKVILINHGQEPYTISRGDRIAQLVVAPVCRVSWLETRDLPRTERGADGFGSSGS